MDNKNTFLSSWGQRLAELGLDVWDVNVGRYVQIDLSKPRPEPEEFAEFGEFDTFVVLNPQDIPEGVWLYLNNKRPESRLPLHYISRLETIADRFYLQHNDSWDGLTLHIILGGDLRVLNIEPSDRGVVTVKGSVDVSDREGRKLGIVSVPGVATELTLEAVRALLESLEAKNFATESTLSMLASKDFATDGKLEAIRVILASLEGKDFATDGKLEAIRVILASLEGKDFATENTLSSVSNTLSAILAELQTQTGLLQQIADNTAGEE